MASASGATHDMIVTDGSIDIDDNAMPRLARAVSPMMVGLIAPFIVLALIEPAALRHIRFLTIAVLLPTLLIAVALYAYSVLSPGVVCGVVVHRDVRHLELVQANAFSIRRLPLAFTDIAAARIVETYDRDGYGTREAVLILHSGERIALPEGTTAGDIAAIKTAVGLP